MDSFFVYEFENEVENKPLPTQSVTDIYRFNGKILDYEDTRSRYVSDDYNGCYQGYKGL